VDQTDNRIAKITGTSHIHTGLVNGTSYYYAVVSLSEEGEESRISGEISAKPSADMGTFTNSLGMTFKQIPAANFVMGSCEKEPGRDGDETQHEVIITNPFYIQTTEVTQGQWKALMGTNPSYAASCGDECPVENVSWFMVHQFIEELNRMENAYTYRLPTEAEWEYAARGKNSFSFANGEITDINCGDDPNLRMMGWYCGNSENKLHPVAQKNPNIWGLYDMHGNVWEWCEDWYGEYPKEAVTDPVGPDTGTYHVKRGGCFSAYARNCRSASRYYGLPSSTSDNIGFRLIANKVD
jgi:formylglycine-generating enzyme required for sulfatase activity